MISNGNPSIIVTNAIMIANVVDVGGGLRVHLLPFDPSDTHAQFGAAVTWFICIKQVALVVKRPHVPLSGKKIPNINVSTNNPTKIARIHAIQRIVLVR